MCQCTPEIKTPFCGKPGCKWPPQRPSGEAPAAPDPAAAGLELRIARLTLRPGDVLVAQTSRDIDAESMGRARRMLNSLVPVGVQTLVLGPDVEISVLTRDEIDARAKPTD